MIEADLVRTAPILAFDEPGRPVIFLAITHPIEVGRDCSGLLLADPSISRRHLVVARHADSVSVTDQGTTNGTMLRGERITTSHVLRPGETVCFGSCTVRLAATAVVDRSEATESGSTSLTGDDGSPLEDVRTTSIDLVARAALADGEVPAGGADAGTMTLVFCDIEDSTSRAVELGDTGWARVIEAHNAVVRRMVERCGGMEVKAQGDGFMLRFRSVRSALTCMTSVLRALQDLATAEPMLAVRVRAGIHTGEVVVGDDGDLYGRHVIVAARVAAQARGGEILVSALVREIVAPRGDVRFGEPRSVELKGLAGRHAVYPVAW